MAGWIASSVFVIVALGIGLALDKLRRRGLKTYECWKGEGGVYTTFASAEETQRQRRTGIISPEAVFLFSLEARSWDDAMTKYHKRMGWEPHRPF